MDEKEISRKSFKNSLELIEDDVINMMGLAKDSVRNSIDAMEKYDKDKVKQVRNAEKRTNDLNAEVEKTCLDSVALYQPVARDLRFIASMMKISDIFERVCDLSDKIADIAESKKDEELLKPLEDTGKIVSNIMHMVKIVKDSVKKRDSSDLRSLSDYDDEIDELFKDIYDELISFMIEDPETVNDATGLLYMARYLERIGDLICKAGSKAVYLIEAERVRIK